MLLRRSWISEDNGEIARNIPFNTPLIPVLSGMSTANGVVTGASVNDSANHVVVGLDKAPNRGEYTYVYTNITTNAYRVFDRSDSGLYFGNYVNDSKDITYTFPNSLYKGRLNKGSYRFTATFSGGSDNTVVKELIYIKDMNNNWIYVGESPYSYNTGQTNVTVDFTVNYDFKGIRMYHTNPNNYDHSRDCFIWNVNIMKLA